VGRPLATELDPRQGEPLNAIGSRVEFASQEWMAAITEILQRAMTGLDTGGRTYTISEEFTDAPAHLVAPGATSIGWHFTVTDDQVEVGQGALQAGDLLTTVDYQACLPVARLVYENTPEAIEEASKLRAAASATGARVGDETSLAPDLLARLLRVHNEVASITR
jgi:hypothetical protein